jgi:hypothetical protein
LLGRLSTRSLEEILRQASLARDEAEWQAEFQRDYHGKTVVFDDVVGRDDASRPFLTAHQVFAGDEKARLALEDLTLLHDLPLEPSQRLLFGARLLRCGREKGGTWVVRFEPDSAVLLTDAGAAAACCPALIGDDVKEVLQRQQRWLENMANLRPAP